MKVYLALFISLLLVETSQLKAQFQITKRSLAPVERDAPAEYELLSLEENGLILISVVRPWRYETNKTFRFVYLDSTLVEKKSFDFVLPYDLVENRLIYYDEEKYLYFFKQSEANKRVSIFRNEVHTNQGKVYEFKLPIRMDVEEFTTLKDEVYMTGRYGGKQVVVAYSFIEQAAKVLPSFYQDNEKMKHIQPDPTNNQIYFTLRNNTLKSCNLLIKPYSNLIGSLAVLRVTEKGQKSPLNALVYSNDNRKKLLIGTYSNACSKNPQGVFVSNFNGAAQKQISFKKFIDFTNFFNYHGEKKADRLRKKVEKKRESGKSMNLTRKIIIHDHLIENNDDLIMVMEGYYNSYQNNQNGLATRNNLNRYVLTRGRGQGVNNFGDINPVNRPSNQFNYAVLCAYDKNGVYQWDNVISIEKVEKNELSPIVEVGAHKDSIILAYRKDDELFSKMIHRFRTIKEETSQEIDELFEPFLVADNQWYELVHWYDNHYLLFGEQRLKNKNQETDVPGNKVFHMTRLTYTPQEEKDDAEVKNNEKKK